LRGAAIVLALSASDRAAPRTAPVCGLRFFFGFASARFWVVFHANVLRYRPGRAGAWTAVVGNLEMLGFGIPVVIGAIADAHGLRTGLLCYARGPDRAVPRRRPRGRDGQRFSVR